MSFKKNLFLGLGISLVLLLLTAVASYISIHNLIKGSEMLKESNRTIRNLNNTLSLIKDAETGQRGYLLSNDTRFLDPYNMAKNKIEAQLDDLENEFADSPTQINDFKKLRQNIDERIEILDENLNIKKSGQ